MNVEVERIQILKEIQENCKRRHMCNGCEYYTDATSCGRIFRNIPSRWLLEQEESMTEEELIKKIKKEEKWLIHALNDNRDVSYQYSVDIAFDAVKHYIKDYINSQQKEGE